jgi:polysaccharide export outer membrane protein
MNEQTKLKSVILTFLVLLSVFSSCVSVKKLKYFNDLDQLEEPVANPGPQRVIRPFDRIYIKVYSIDEKTNQLFNSNEAIPMNSSSNIITYLVDESGSITYPFIGKINLAGLTLEKAGTKLGESLGEYVTNAAVVVKFIESNITVLGQVTNQGVHSYNQDKLSIYEALALGGGITQYGNRKSVILIRKENGRIVHHKLDLSNSAIAAKEDYYVQNNDIIIVEPTRAASWYNFNSNSFTLFVSTLLTIFSLWYIKKG